MTIILPALAVAFAAFCVWLTVRIVNRKERWAKWTAVGIAMGLPVAYLLGFGIACRATSIPLGGSVAIPSQIMEIYSPIGVLAVNRGTRAASVIHWYMRFWTRPQECVLLHTGYGKYTAVFPYPPARRIKSPTTHANSNADSN